MRSITLFRRVRLWRSRLPWRYFGFHYVGRDKFAPALPPGRHPYWRVGLVYIAIAIPGAASVAPPPETETRNA